jgi:2-(3-amino-3-carboxypropyl)histidine synthase
VTSIEPNLNVIPILLSELSPAKLKLFEPHFSAFIQTSCPRLSIDWGYAFERPLLSPYEATVAFGTQTGWSGDTDWNYPMDFYATGTPWSNARLRGYF